MIALLLWCALATLRAEPPWVVSSRPSRAPAALDCPLRALVATYAGALNSRANATDFARSLLLADLCPGGAGAQLPTPPSHQRPRPLWEAPPPRPFAPGGAGLCSLTSPPPIVFFVAPNGSDAASGSQAEPFASLPRALSAAGAGTAPACIWLRGGTYRLAAAVVLSRSNTELAAFPGETPVLSGAVPFDTPSWAPFATPNASAGACWVAAGAAPRGLAASALFDAAGARRFVRARWPNSARSDAPYPSAWAPIEDAAWLPAPPAQRCESNVTTVATNCFQNYTGQGGMAACFEARTGCGSLRFEPPIEPGTPRSVCGSTMSPLCNTVPGGLSLPEAAPGPFANPQDVLVHYMKNIDARGLGWYTLSWAVASASGRNLTFGAGGAQSGQGRVADGARAPFSLEGALELLDAEGEYHYDARTGDVYLCGAAGGGAPAVASLQLAASPYLLSLEGGGGSGGAPPLASVSVRGLSFSFTRSTILEGHAVPGGGDLAAHPRGALSLRGVEGATVAGCTFTHVGGSAVAVTGHALGVQVVDSAVLGAGAHGVLVLGTSVLNDATGPALPRGVRVAGNVLRGTGAENKFAAAIAIALAPRAVVEGNVAYEMPRTAIYYNDVAGSPGQLMRNNVLFNTNRETVDTGPVYVYNRLAFVGDNAGGPSVVPDVSNHTQNLILNNYGGNWPLDFDDGSQYIEDSKNVFIYGGSKQYLGCCTSHHGDFMVYPDLSDNSYNNCNLQAGAEQYRSGYGHRWYNNTCLLSTGAGVAYNYESCSTTDAQSPPRISSFNNTFLSPAAGAGGLAAVPISCAGAKITLAAWSAASGMEAGSATGPLPDPAALSAQLLAYLPGPEAGGGGGAWGF